MCVCVCVAIEQHAVEDPGQAELQSRPLYLLLVAINGIFDHWDNLWLKDEESLAPVVLFTRNRVTREPEPCDGSARFL